MWWRKKEEKHDAYHQDDVLWGKGITDMFAKAVTATELDQSEEMKADTEGDSLEASIHADPTQPGGPKKPAERQQLQSGRQLKSMLMLKPNRTQCQSRTHHQHQHLHQHRDQHQHRRQEPH